jgi:hypothetical protein
VQYGKVLERHGIWQSMSWRGNCLGNAPIKHHARPSPGGSPVRRVTTFALLLTAGPLLACAPQQATPPMAPMTAAQYATFQRAMGDPKTRARVVATCAERAKTRSAQELGTMAAVLDVDVAEAPQVYCERLFAAVARGELGYDDYMEEQARKHDPQVLRRLLRALRQPADEQRV